MKAKLVAILIGAAGIVSPAVAQQAVDVAVSAPSGTAYSWEYNPTLSKGIRSVTKDVEDSYTPAPPGQPPKPPLMGRPMRTVFHIMPAANAGTAVLEWRSFRPAQVATRITVKVDRLKP